MLFKNMVLIIRGSSLVSRHAKALPGIALTRCSDWSCRVPIKIINAFTFSLLFSSVKEFKTRSRHAKALTLGQMNRINIVLLNICVREDQYKIVISFFLDDILNRQRGCRKSFVYQEKKS